MNKIPLAEGIFKWQDTAKTINNIISAIFWISPDVNKNCGEIEPPGEYKRDGLLAYADGTNWDPGSGKGLYRYDGDTTSWVKIG